MLIWPPLFELILQLPMFQGCPIPLIFIENKDFIATYAGHTDVYYDSEGLF